MFKNNKSFSDQADMITKFVTQTCLAQNKIVSKPYFTLFTPQTNQADMITNMIGYPDYIMNNSALEEKYSDLFAEENSYFANSVRFNKVST